MPLVYSGTGDAEPITEKHERARKINPQYARGEAVKVGFALNQAEAELMQGLLLEEGVPSFIRRSPGFDVPDFLAAGPREIMVPESGAEAARDVLAAPAGDDTEMRSEGAMKLEAVAPRPVLKIFIAIMVIAALGFLILLAAAAVRG